MFCESLKLQRKITQTNISRGRSGGGPPGRAFVGMTHYHGDRTSARVTERCDPAAVGRVDPSPSETVRFDITLTHRKGSAHRPRMAQNDRFLNNGFYWLQNNVYLTKYGGGKQLLRHQAMVGCKKLSVSYHRFVLFHSAFPSRVTQFYGAQPPFPTSTSLTETVPGQHEIHQRRVSNRNV